MTEDDIKNQIQDKAARDRKKVGFYYSFLTIVLLFCLIQIGFGVILNISKTIAYQGKIVTLKKIRDDAQENNASLKREIQFFSTGSSLEEIARNNLKMAGKDEVLVLINGQTRENNTKEDFKTRFKCRIQKLLNM